MIDVIRQKLQKARKNKDSLESEFQDLEEKLREIEKGLFTVEGEIGVLLELLKSAGLEDNVEKDRGEFELSKNNTDETIKKPRAQRATKEEMKKRFHAVGGIFFEKGDLTVKELEPLLNEALGYELEAHRQRGILYRYPNVFEPKEEHGIWGLTEEGRDYFSSLNVEDRDSE